MTLRGGFKLGWWTVLPLEGRIFNGDDANRVQPKSMDVLLCLAEAGGDVVERDDLLRQVWGDRAVSDEPLTRCIGELRRALGDSRSRPAYIQTIPKRGYQLIQEAVPLAVEQPDGSDGPSPRHRFTASSTVRKSAVGIAVIVLGIALGSGIVRWSDSGRIESGVDLTGERIERSLAVLPFVDMSEGQDQGYMGDGIAEELLNLLARIPELRVISRSSSFSLKGEAIDVRQIAERFGVGYILEGSVRTSGDRIRVTAQLVDGRTDAHVWSETYERRSDDVFSIQDEIAQTVASKLRFTLLGESPRSRPTDPDAYALFLQGRSSHEQPGADAMRRAIDYYKAALEIDPRYVPAWVWLAAAYDDVVNSLDMPRAQVVELARASIDRALAIDPDDPLALGMYAVLIQAWDGDLPRAAQQMQRALELDPSNPYLLRWSAIILVSVGRHEDAVHVMEYLFARDPIGNITRINLAETYLNAGRFDDAVHFCEIEVALSTENTPCGSRLILARLYSGDADGALELLESLESSRVVTRLAPMVFHANDRAEDYDRSLAALLAAYEAGDDGLAYWLAVTYAFVGDKMALYRWMEATASAGTLAMTPNLAFFEEYESDPRFQRVLADLGMAPSELANISFKLPALSATR